MDNKTAAEVVEQANGALAKLHDIEGARTAGVKFIAATRTAAAGAA